MSKIVLLFSLLFIATGLFSNSSAYESLKSEKADKTKFFESGIAPNQDTLFANQILYNGKIWIGLYFGVYGTEFLFSDDWIDSDLAIAGVELNGLPLKYDIYNDELLVNYNNKKVIILNRERVDSFTIRYNSSFYRFTNFRDHILLNGYHQVLYDDYSSLYKKWGKKRAQFVVEAKYDEFQPDHKLILIKDQVRIEITSRRGFLKNLIDEKQRVKEYIRENRLKLDIKSPETLVPVLKFYDTLKTQ